MKIEIILLIVLCSIFFILLILKLLSYLIYHRSLMASVVEIYLKLFTKKYTDDEVKRLLQDLKNQKENKYNIPKILNYKNNIENVIYNGMQVLVFNKNNNTDKAIIYLHGGAYFRKPRFHHIKFLKKLAKNSNLTVYMPIYPKVPHHEVLGVYDLLTKYYLELRKKYESIYLMGDSSGGGLALGLCQSFLLKEITQPNEIILFSPWVDISLDNKKIKNYINKDPLLKLNEIKILGRYWANNLPNDDYRVSPIYGNIIGLKSVTIFIGTREILYPDNILLFLLLKESKVNAKLHVGRGLNHVYPIYPIIEAKKAMEETLKIISR